MAQVSQIGCKIKMNETMTTQEQANALAINMTPYQMFLFQDRYRLGLPTKLDERTELIGENGEPSELAIALWDMLKRK